MKPKKPEFDKEFRKWFKQNVESNVGDSEFDWNGFENDVWDRCIRYYELALTHAANICRKETTDTELIINPELLKDREYWLSEKCRDEILRLKYGRQK